MKPEVRNSEKFKMAVRNLIRHQKENDARDENRMSYNYRALADDSCGNDCWLGTKIYDELVEWAAEQGWNLSFYNHQNIRGDWHLCFTCRW